MGWTYQSGEGKPSEVFAEFKRLYTGIMYNGDCYMLDDLRYTSQGELWAKLIVNGNFDSILVMLIKWRGGKWGYKVMPCESHPHNYHCPLEWLDELEANNPSILSSSNYTEWATEVRIYNEK
jgi:hypothetical protein